MDELTPTANWTVSQPWRGLFGIIVTIGIALTITSLFDAQAYGGFFTLMTLSNIPFLVILTLGLQVQYPPTDGMPRPWGAILFTALIMAMGYLIGHALTSFMAGGAATPFIQVQAIFTVICTFFLVIAFGMWPFTKLSLPGKGFLTMILAYVLGWLFLKLLNFSMLSFPDGVIPSAVGAVPFYAEGGPLAPFAALAPTGGPFIWETGLTFSIWSLIFLWVFVMLQMWPFSKFPSVMKQPVMGIVVTVTCCVLGIIALIIGGGVLKIAPLLFLLYGICTLFGLLMIITMFQMWPGRTAKSPVAGGFLNILIAIIVAIIAYFAIKAFCISHFGADPMKHPTEVFTMATFMLAITFPAWAAYGVIWDFWPLPPTPPPPEPGPEA